MGKDYEFLEACKIGDKRFVETSLLNCRRSSFTNAVVYPLGKRSLNALLTANDTQSGYSGLHYCALHNHEDICSLLLAQGADPFRIDRRSCTSLHLAAWNGNHEIVKLILQHDAKGSLIDLRNADGCTALHLAAQFGHSNTVSILTQRGADICIRNNSLESALDVAARYGREQCVRLLCNARHSIVFDLPPLSSSDKPNGISFDLKFTTLGDGSDCAPGLPTHTALELAARNGYAPTVSTLLSFGHPVDTFTLNGTPLMQAALFGREQCIRILLQHGAALDVRHPLTGQSLQEMLESQGTIAQLELLKRLVTEHYQNKPDSSHEYANWPLNGSHLLEMPRDVEVRKMPPPIKPRTMKALPFMQIIGEVNVSIPSPNSELNCSPKVRQSSGSGSSVADEVSIKNANCLEIVSIPKREFNTSAFGIDDDGTPLISSPDEPKLQNSLTYEDSGLYDNVNLQETSYDNLAPKWHHDCRTRSSPDRFSAQRPVSEFTNFILKRANDNSTPSAQIVYPSECDKLTPISLYGSAESTSSLKKDKDDTTNNCPSYLDSETQIHCSIQALQEQMAMSTSHIGGASCDDLVQTLTPPVSASSSNGSVRTCSTCSSSTCPSSECSQCRRQLSELHQQQQQKAKLNDFVDSTDKIGHLSYNEKLKESVLEGSSFRSSFDLIDLKEPGSASSLNKLRQQQPSGDDVAISATNDELKVVLRAHDLLDAENELRRLGYDQPAFLKSFDTNLLLTANDAQKSKLAAMIDNSIGLPPANSMAVAHQYVSDWLHTLKLDALLGMFLTHGIDTIDKVLSLDDVLLRDRLGISQPGYRQRILSSLGVRIRHLPDRHSAQLDNSAVTNANAVCEKQQKYFLSHYIGSAEVTMPDAPSSSTQLTREAIAPLKERKAQILKLPVLRLCISAAGIECRSPESQFVVVHDALAEIVCVCQDTADRSFLAYLARDPKSNRLLAHLFALASEVECSDAIILLGHLFQQVFRQQQQQQHNGNS